MQVRRPQLRETKFTHRIIIESVQDLYKS
jgi:hypothetical protein